MTNEEMAQEIKRLQKSEYVKLYNETERTRLQRMMYKLRWQEKQGKKIAAQQTKEGKNG